MKKIVIVFIGSLVWAFTYVSVFAEETTQTISMMHTAQSGYHPDDLQMLTKIFKDLSGIEVNIDYIRYEDQYEKVPELASTYDVLSLDQIWLADFASKGFIIPLDKYITKKIRTDINPAILKAFQYQRQTWAFPFLANFQLLFYNTMMLEKAGFARPPATLEEMVEQMITLKDQGIVKYPWTDAWRQNEGLICEFVWLTRAFGGKLFDKKGLPVFDQNPGVEALEFMVMLLKDQLANPNILTHDEIAAKDDFISGEAAFTSNWIFQTGLPDNPEVSKIVGQKSIGSLPASKTITQKTASVSAFQGIAITANSKQKDLAWKWITFLTSPLVQRAFLFEMPIWISVQTSKDVNILDPRMSIKRAQLQNVYHRPNIPNYPEISLVLQRHIYAALEGRIEPSDALSKAKTEIETLIGSELK